MGRGRCRGRENAGAEGASGVVVDEQDAGGIIARGEQRHGVEDLLGRVRADGVVPRREALPVFRRESFLARHEHVDRVVHDRGRRAGLAGARADTRGDLRGPVFGVAVRVVRHPPERPAVLRGDAKAVDLALEDAGARTAQHLPGRTPLIGEAWVQVSAIPRVVRALNTSALHHLPLPQVAFVVLTLELRERPHREGQRQ